MRACEERRIAVPATDAHGQNKLPSGPDEIPNELQAVCQFGHLHIKNDDMDRLRQVESKEFVFGGDFPDNGKAGLEGDERAQALANTRIEIREQDTNWSFPAPRCLHAVLHRSSPGGHLVSERRLLPVNHAGVCACMEQVSSTDRDN